MTDVEPFARVVALVSVAVLVAVLSNRISEWIRVPAPALFLVAAAVAADLFPVLGTLSIEVDGRIVTVALIFILFDGGMHIGWARFRTAAGAVVLIGVAGTVVTAGALALCAHLIFGFDWLTALLIGTALSPTDPAVVFSVLGRREISGRSGTILEGESGANDPVGIALMVSLLGATGGGVRAVAGGAGEFALQILVGTAVGVGGGFGLRRIMRFALPNEALYPIRALAAATLVYGVGSLLGGSGFLAVLLTGIIVGDTRAPYKREIERFAAGMASLAEIVAFTVLGLTVSVKEVFQADELWVGLALAGILILLVRPVLVGLVTAGITLTLGERAFVLWAGLKGAVPILLGTFILAAGQPQARRVYGIIFVVVLVSVVVQGALVPTFAQLFKVPMQVVEPEPWALGMRFKAEPRGLHRHLVAAGSPAEGSTVRRLDVGDDAWLSMVSRDGRLLDVRGSTTLAAGDEVLALADPATDLTHLFAAPPQADPTSAADPPPTS